jgi:hypothetical protein
VIDLYLRIGLILGAALTLFYLIIRIRRLQNPELTEGLNLFIGSLGMIMGIKVCLLSLDPSKLTSIGDYERFYIFLGGFSAFWISFQSLIRVFNKFRIT